MATLLVPIATVVMLTSSGKVFLKGLSAALPVIIWTVD